MNRIEKSHIYFAIGILVIGYIFEIQGLKLVAAGVFFGLSIGTYMYEDK